MVSIYDVKPAFQALLRPACRGLAARGITANQVTVAALLLSIAAGAAVATGSPAALLALPVVLFVRMALNAIDGMLAREHGQKSRLGGLLNELGDVVADAALFAPFALVEPRATWAVASFVWASALTEAAGLAALQAGSERRYDGPLGKSDRAFLVGALGLGLGLGWIPRAWLPAVFWTATLLALVTVAQRMRGALRTEAAQ